MNLRIAAIAALVTWTGCASVPPPVEIAGAAAELRNLVGDWTGTYEYQGHGRRGTIRMNLRVDPASDATIAFGDVLMIPLDADRNRHPPGSDAPAGEVPAAAALAIRFVRVSDGMVSGTMEPYQDPEGGALLSTSFLGRIEKDAISGTFLASGGTANVPRRGTWKVTRTAAPH